MSIVVTATVTTANAIGITVSVPSGASVGDWLFASVQVSGTIATPAGWFLLSQAGPPTFFRQINGTEPSTYTFTGNGGTTGLAGAMLLVKGGYGVGGGFVMDGLAGNGFASNTNITAPTTTASKNASETLVSIFVTGTANTITLPGTQTSLASTTGNSRAINVGIETLSSLGATGTRVATCGTAAINSGINLVFYVPFGAIGAGTDFPDRMLAVPNFWAGAVSVGGKVQPSTDEARLMPFWLVDYGLSWPLGATPNTTAVAQQGVQVVGRAMWPADASGKFVATYEINTVPKAGVFIALYYRKTGACIASAVTDASGQCVFSGLDQTVDINNGYWALARDPDGLATQYATLVFDRLTPVPA